MRKSGVLLHISSLPSPYGIGTMGKEAYKFVRKVTDMYGIVEYDLDFCYQVPEKAWVFLLEKWKLIPFTEEELKVDTNTENKES